MSRLTKSPFHAPSPFEFPRAPLSPPETNGDYISPSHVPSVAGAVDMHAGDATEFLSPSAGISMSESPSAGARFRRVSSLAYHSSGFHSSRERLVQRPHKSFICVIPPATLLQEHGQLGHTLSLGPHHRLAQGLLMPLFPTMYGQLTAIAKEFNFPSTAGLCLYMHYTDNGVTVTPRISDEYWPIIWSSSFDVNASTGISKPPICGKVEFDIDLRHARWYSAWLGSAHRREHLDLPASIAPSTAPSMIHFRESSRTTVEDALDDERKDIGHPKQRSSRHVPRQLSLVDRLENMSIRSTNSRVRSALSPPENVITASQVLSPIHQEEEPKSAKRDLESRVNTWRASASLTPTALAARGQTSLEPANMPNSIILDDTILPGDEGELNLEDYQWSVSSLGPNDYDPESPMSSDRVYSVHMANRAEGSVCLTPSDCTSFGPSDYTLPSPVASSVRLLTPDIAQRMFDDVPLTPSTATSWGPPSIGLESPISEYYAASLDLGERAVFSRPLTPFTATSWGPASWPASPVKISRPPSIHLGDRGVFSRPATPPAAMTWGAPSQYPPSPIPRSHVATPDTGHRASDGDDNESQQRIFSFPYYDPFKADQWTFTWPYMKEHSAEDCHVEEMDNNVPWRDVWPYHDDRTDEHTWKHVWPYMKEHSAEDCHVEEMDNVPWRHVWPSRTDEPTWKHVWPYTGHTQEKSDIIGVWKHTWPYSKGSTISTDPWSSVWPYHRGTQSQVAGVPVTLTGNYPSLIIYRAVYPAIEIYPTLQLDDVRSSEYPDFNLYPPVNGPINTPRISRPDPIVISLAVPYPSFDIYPAVYPGNVYQIYPGLTVEKHTLNVDKKLVPEYPNVCPYPADYSQMAPYSDYPHFDIYPSVGFTRSGLVYKKPAEPEVPEVSPRTVISVKLQPHYPVFELYPETYPFISIYPSVSSFEGYPHFDLYSEGAASDSENTADRPKTSILVRLEAHYPCFNLYVPQYPMLEIYPPAFEATLARETPCYPDFVVYPPVNQIKPQVKYNVEFAQAVSYPVFNIYPAVYPYFDIYPVIQGGDTLGLGTGQQWCTRLQAQYHTFCIYPAAYPVYPHFDLYSCGVCDLPHPQHAHDRVLSPSSEVGSVVRYPVLEIYPSVYPFFNLYPEISGRRVDTEKEQQVLMAKIDYPVFDIYPAVHMSEQRIVDSPQDLISVQVVHQYPTFVIYPPLYPHHDIYPSVAPAVSTPRSMDSGLSPAYPFFEIYRAAYPNFVLWPEEGCHTIVTKRRLTHAQLHDMVMNSELLLVRPQEPRRRVSWARRTHKELHDSVFLYGDVSTPSGTWRLPLSERPSLSEGPPPPPSGPLPPLPSEESSPSTVPSRRSSSLRARSGSIARMSIANGGLPPHPSYLRMSSIIEPVMASDHDNTERAHSPLSIRRSVSVASRPVVKRTEAPPSLSPVEERSQTLQRSRSTVGPPDRPSPMPVNRSSSASVTGTPARKRDSLVLQRVKALNDASGNGSSVVSLDSLSKFPMPPRPLPQPAGPRMQRTSRYMS